MLIEDLIKAVAKFRDERDWKKFHSPKNLAISLVIEASELLEIFQWTLDNGFSVVDLKRNEIEEEIADVFIYLLLLVDALNVDLEKAFLKKMKKNEQKYPVEKVKGKFEHNLL